jgi:hypothetical protein
MPWNVTGMVVSVHKPARHIRIMGHAKPAPAHAKILIFMAKKAHVVLHVQQSIPLIHVTAMDHGPTIILMREHINGAETEIVRRVSVATILVRVEKLFVIPVLLPKKIKSVVKMVVEAEVMTPPVLSP